MIKKLKIGFLVTALSLVVAGVAYADPLTFSSDTTVTVNSRSYTIGAGSTATSIVVGSTTLAATVPSGSYFSFISTNRDTLANDLSLTQTCSNSQNSVTVSGPVTVTFTPTSTACTSSGGSGGLAAGDTGGGSTTTTVTPSGNTTSAVAQSSTPVTLSISPDVTMTTLSPGCSGGNKYNTSTGEVCVNNSKVSIAGCVGTNGFSTVNGQSCANNNVTVINTNGGNTSSISVPGIYYDFGTVTLKNGSKGDGVKELQRFLNAKLNLSLTVDGKLGPKTIAIVKQWQKDHGLKADGVIGAKTKLLMNTSTQ